MSDPKFTSGPWHAHFDDRADEWTARLPRVKGAAGQVFMCEIAGPDDSREANAHLIAAAPELYEACRIALEYWHSDHPNDTVAGEEARAKIEAALAKAEGRK